MLKFIPGFGKIWCIKGKLSYTLLWKVISVIFFIIIIILSIYLISLLNTLRIQKEENEMITESYNEIWNKYEKDKVSMVWDCSNCGHIGYDGKICEFCGMEGSMKKREMN
jgi:hypothetical protein